MEKAKLNRYEKKALSPVTNMKALYLALVLLNLFLPLFKPDHFGIVGVYQWAVLVVHFIGLLNGIGYFSQSQPILPLFFVRSAEVLWYKFGFSYSMNWTIFLCLIFLDFLFIAYMLSDKKKFEYKTLKN